MINNNEENNNKKRHLKVNNFTIYKIYSNYYDNFYIPLLFKSIV